MFASKRSGRRRGGPKGTIKDPLRARLKPIPEPSDEALVKHDTASPGLAAGGTPAAGRTTLDEARRKGLVGWLQLLRSEERRVGKGWRWGGWRGEGGIMER